MKVVRRRETVEGGRPGRNELAACADRRVIIVGIMPRRNAFYRRDELANFRYTDWGSLNHGWSHGEWFLREVKGNERYAS